MKAKKMSKTEKAFYNEIPIGEWVERSKFQDHQTPGPFFGQKRWGWQLFFSRHFHLFDVKFENDVQLIRRKPTTELMK